MSIIPVRLKLLLPPNAHLPKAQVVLGGICIVLDNALSPAKRFRRLREDRDNDLRLAIGVHALNALDAAHAVHILSGTDHAGGISPHFRAVFEALVKIRWMRKDSRRAKAYLDSEPFERFAHATTRVRSSSRWQIILNDCETAVKQNPDLLVLPKASSKNGQPNFKAIARALRMPMIQKMIDDIGMDEDDYLLDFDVPSLYPHTSVMHTKSFAKNLNYDGTVTLSTTIDPITLLGYVTRTATRTGEILKEVLDVFPDGAILFEAEKVAAQLTEVVTEVKGYIPESEHTSCPI